MLPVPYASRHPYGPPHDSPHTARQGSGRCRSRLCSLERYGGNARSPFRRAGISLPGHGGSFPLHPGIPSAVRSGNPFRTDTSGSSIRSKANRSTSRAMSVSDRNFCTFLTTLAWMLTRCRTVDATHKGSRFRLQKRACVFLILLLLSFQSIFSICKMLSGKAFSALCQ